VEFKNLLCDEQETKKTNKKEETKVKDKEALLKNADKCN